MKEIRFNQNYTKLHGQNLAQVIHIGIRTGKRLEKEFIEYDTDGKFEIEPETAYMIIYLIGNKQIPFTTIRKANDENLEKYNEKEFYKIVVDEKPLPNHWYPQEEK